MDLWAAACIIVEMSNCVPLFPGDSEIDQLFRVFRCLGTPSNVTWPGVEELCDYSPRFPQWPERPPGPHCVPRMDPCGLDLLRKLLLFNPNQRLSAREALEHEYFVL